MMVTHITNIVDRKRHVPSLSDTILLVGVTRGENVTPLATDLTPNASAESKMGRSLSQCVHAFLNATQ